MHHQTEENSTYAARSGLDARPSKLVHIGETGGTKSELIALKPLPL